jgi:hypothetical protein
MITHPIVDERAEDAEALPECVTAVLASRTFQRAHTLRTLLDYLWKHRDELLCEYAIATDALRRNQDFDPKIDATVRVQISRLRQRLDKYYEAEGGDCRQRITIPLGSHHLEILAVDETAIDIAKPMIVAAPTPKGNRVTLLLAIACGALVILSGVLGLQLLRISKETAPNRTAISNWFWKAFFKDGRGTRVILPTPTFFSWHIHANRPAASVMFRDTDINDFGDRAKSESITKLERSYGRPTLAQSYTVTSDTFAAIRLSQYLDRGGFETTATSSASAPLEMLDHENVIALGTWGTLSPLQPFLDRMTFQLIEHEQSVINKRPAAGEPARMDQVVESPARGTWLGVIAVLPGQSRQTQLLILASRHTAALVSFLTSVDGLAQLQNLWRLKGSPEYYEVVVAAEMDGETLVRFWPVALHPFRNSA